MPEASQEMDTRGGTGCRLPTPLCHRQDALRASRRALGRRRLHPAPVRQEGLSGKEGTTPASAAATPGLSRRRGPGRRLAPASLGCLPAPPRGGRQMGQQPAQLRRQETAAGAAREASVSGGGGVQCGPALRGRGRGAEPAALGSDCAYSWVSLGQSVSFSEKCSGLSQLFLTL